MVAEGGESPWNESGAGDSPPPRLLLATAATEPGFALAARHADRGWRVTHVTDGAAAVAAAGLGGYALIRLVTDLPRIDAADVAVRIRRWMDDQPPVPIHVTPPDDAMIAAPSDFPHRPAPPRPDPLRQLTPLLGPTAVHTLMQRFHDRLVLLCAAPDPYAIGEGATPHALAHRVGGLAGILGFGDLAAAWLAVEQDGVERMDAAWIETHIARATLALLLEDPAPDGG